MILSATIRGEYVEKQGFKVNQSIAEDLEVKYHNLKIVQLLADMDGKRKVMDSIEDQSIDQKHQKMFRLLLRKHQQQAIALITTKEEDSQDKKSLLKP